MRFEARDLKSYAEPVSATDLRVGEVYFNVQFEDDKLHIPVVEPLIFLGRNLDEGDTNFLYFQDFESYAMGVRLRVGHRGRRSRFSRVWFGRDKPHLRI